jgi:hypothetical protein
MAVVVTVHVATTVALTAIVAVEVAAFAAADVTRSAARVSKLNAEMVRLPLPLFERTVTCNSFEERSGWSEARWGDNIIGIPCGSDTGSNEERFSN